MTKTGIGNKSNVHKMMKYFCLFYIEDIEDKETLSNDMH